MTRGDRVIIALVACIAIVSIPLVTMASSGPSASAVVQAPGGRTVLDLNRDAEYEIEGRHGVVCLEVRAGGVSAVEAQCPDQVCVRSGAVRAGRPVVCAPNGVSVMLSSSDGSGFDAVSR